MLLSMAIDLRQALTRYAEAVLEDERRATRETARAREERARTLCEMTGTSDVVAAIHAATAFLGRRVAGPHGRSRRGGVRARTGP